MRWPAKVFMRMRSLFGRERADRDLDDELSFHLERQIALNMAAGMSREEARRAALREFGGVDQIREECVDMRNVHWLQDFVQDLHYGLRVLRKSPSFTVVSILTIALGIGATTVIFSVVYGVLLESLPYRDASRLIVLNETTPKVGMVSVSYMDFLDWRAQTHAFSQMSAVHNVGFNLAGITQPENISGDAVSPNFLSMLGVHPYLGRDFVPSEEKTRAPVVLLSYSLWQSHFGADPAAVGRTITLDERSFTIIGVLPPTFRSPDRTDILEPIGVWAAAHADEATGRGERGDMVVIGRLADATLAEARVEMDGIAARLAHEYPATNDQFGVKLQPIRDVFVGDIGTTLLVLFGSVLFVLLIACANVANLLLVRGSARAKELALQAAFGASRGRIIRQLLTESFVLALLGGAVGVALAMFAIRSMNTLIPPQLLAGAPIVVDAPVLLFAASIIVLVAFVFGLVPAVQSAKADVQSELKERSRASSGTAQQVRLRSALAIAEISLSVILLAGTGLMVKSLYRLLSVNPGFQTGRLLTMTLDLRTQKYAKDPAILNFWQQVLDRVRVVPGVESAALGTVVPMTDSHSRSDIMIEDMPIPKPGSFPHPDYHNVSPGYVSTLGIPLLHGRSFTDEDSENAPLVGMVNATLAREYFPHVDPIGKRFTFGHATAANPPKWITIVGVVGDTKLYGLANPARLEVYIPLRQSAPSEMTLIVESSVDATALIREIRGAVASIDKDQPVFAISTMKQLVDQNVSTSRITFIILGLFSALAVVLATIGIYGVISYSVAQRTHEIGIRLALGAQHAGVLRMILSEGAKIASVGIILGVIAALGLTRLMSSLLFSISASDPATFGAVVLLLAAVALLACYIPARRAVRVDPMVALRYE